MTTGMPAGPAVADGRDALCRYAPVPVPEAAQGPLSGLTFCVKDLFDVAGYPTGCGHPLKLAQSPIATAHAPPVAALLAAGARFTGKTQLDELAYSLNGQNAHYGTPVNPAAPGRIPGGSSSGSSVAVAAGLADIGLGQSDRLFFAGFILIHQNELTSVRRIDETVTQCFGKILPILSAQSPRLLQNLDSRQFRTGVYKT